MLNFASGEETHQRRNHVNKIYRSSNPRQNEKNPMTVVLKTYAVTYSENFSADQYIHRTNECGTMVLAEG